MDSREMNDQEWRKTTEKWTRTVNGDAICPRCGALIHCRVLQWHGDTCGITDHNAILGDSSG